MADQFYVNYARLMLGDSGASGSLRDLQAAGPRLILRDEGADALNTADDFLDDILAAARESTSGALTADTTVADGYIRFEDETLTAVSGDTVESIDFYWHTGTEATSELICNVDSAAALPYTPQGVDVIIGFPTPWLKLVP